MSEKSPKTNKIYLHLQSISISAIIETVKKIFNSQILDKDIELQIDVADNLPNIYVDVYKIVWVLTSIVSNSLRYTSRWGQIIIQASFDANNNQVLLLVKDNGIGIDNKKMDNLFIENSNHINPLDLVDKSISLGLAKEIINSHGTSLDVSNNDNQKGITVSLSLPIEHTS